MTQTNTCSDAESSNRQIDAYVGVLPAAIELVTGGDVEKKPRKARKKQRKPGHYVPGSDLIDDNSPQY